MAKQNAKQQETVATETVSKTESFFENNNKVIMWILATLCVVVCAVFAFKYLYLDPREDKAADMMFEPQYYFDQGQYELALNGDENSAGFLEVADTYSGTKYGNLANYYAGVCYLKTGDSDNAALYLSKYRSVAKRSLPGQIINAQCYGLQGDIAVDKSDYNTALNLYEKAIKASNNEYFTPLYMYKKALVHEKLGSTDEAKELYEQILTSYPESALETDAQKRLGVLSQTK